MNSALRILRIVLAVLLIAASGALLAGWWIVRGALPQLDGTVTLPELKNEVRVERDQWGIPRIRAASLEDLETAQGYVQAQDRLWQMDILRRAAGGELSEIFGPATLALDRENRTLGLRVAADETAKNLAGAARGVLEAYARGVNRYITERRGRLPWEFRVLGYDPRPWSPRDSLLIGGFMWKELTDSWRFDLWRERVAARVGAERAKDMYDVQSAHDRYLVGRTQSLREKTATQHRKVGSDGPLPSPAQDSEKLLAAFSEETAAMAGSNNWVLSGAHTYSGKPILANDTHLRLDVPCIWYMLHVTAPGWNVKGFTLPGVPLVILGHNERIAWGFTNNGADVQDLYIETFNPANREEYRVNGKWVKAERRKETVRVRGQADVVFDVVLTRHGPIVHREGERFYALRWVATEPGGLSFGYPQLGRARNWQEFQEILRGIAGPAQNIIYADVDGNIGYQVAARIPIRKHGHGEIPRPGDTDDYEWIGKIPYDELPQLFNPPAGIIATANAQIAGPGYRWHMTSNWMGPYRTARIYALLEATKKHRPADSIKVQTDIVSLPHLFLAGELTRALRTASPRDPRTRRLLVELAGWDSRATADSVSAAFLEFTRRAALRNLLRPFLGENTNDYRAWRATSFLENILRERPARWQPATTNGGYERMLMASADEAVRQMEKESGSADPTRWRWGRFIQLQILHPLGRSGFLRRHLSVGPIAQSGTSSTVKQTGTFFGPSQRFVADMSNLDNSLMNITLGESGQFLSRHYRDQFEAWFEGYGIPSVFSDSAQEKTTVHRLVLRP